MSEVYADLHVDEDCTILLYTHHSSLTIFMYKYLMQPGNTVSSKAQSTSSFRCRKSDIIALKN